MMLKIEKTNKSIFIAGKDPIKEPGIPSEYFFTPVGVHKMGSCFLRVGSMVDPASLVCGNAGSTMDPAITTWERAEIPPHRFYSWFGGRNIFLD